MKAGESIETLRCRINLAAQYIAEGKRNEALSILAETQASLGGFADNALELAAVYHHLAVLRMADGRYDEAESLIKTAVQAREEALGDCDVLVAQSMVVWGHIYCMRGGPLLEARRRYEYALQILENAYGPDHVNVAALLVFIGSLNIQYENIHRVRKYDDPAELFKRALAIYYRAYGQEHVNVARVLSKLAQIYDWQANYERSGPIFERVLEIFEKELGPDHPEVAFAKRLQAASFKKQGRFAEAEPLYNNALSIYERAGRDPGLEMIQCLHEYANLLCRTNRQEAADKIEARAAAIEQSLAKP